LAATHRYEKADSRMYPAPRIWPRSPSLLPWIISVLNQIGAHLASDGEYHGDLVAVLEVALDYPQHEQAAQRCSMHRNTFRHRLRMATQVLGHDLKHPDVRLAMHVALNLRRMIGRA
jgi:DNA-binding PucR family transcriptional regulator